MKRFLKNTFLVSILLLCAGITFAQSNPVSWSTKVNDLPDNTYQLVFEAAIADGWHLYDMGPYPGGPNPTIFSFEKNADIELIGKVEYLTKVTKVFDRMFNMEIGYFEGKAQFGQKVRLKSASASLKANVEWMACDNGTCIPPTDEDLVFELKGKTASEALSPSNSSKGTTGTGVVAGDSVTATDGSSEPISNAQNEASAKTTDTSADTVSETSDDKQGASIWSLILQALAWGMAALITPCVFPMIPMTVSFFIKGSDNKVRGRFRAFMYGLFIVLLYTVPIALIIVLTWILGGDSVTADIFNWLATHWIPNIIFFIVFMIFAASFFGAFEIVMPSRLVNKSDSKSDKKGLGGVFFMALTLVLVSFSCTGPIVGTVLIKSTSGEFWAPILTMLAFSLAFALPFTLFALFPSWLKKLPKSGGWLNTVKVVLGFIEVALGFKFLSVADQTYQWGLLDREVYLAIWIVVFSMLGFYLLGKLRFKNDSPVEHVSVTRLSLSIAVFSFVVYMIPGMWGAPLKAISGYLPPLQTQDFVLTDTPSNVIYNSAPITSAMPANIKYGDSGLELPHGMEGFFDLAEAEQFAEKVGKPLFIDFTGLGCMNCREMEARVLSDPEILKIIRDHYVVVAMFGDDKNIKVDEKEWVVTESGKTLKTLGKINSYYALKQFGINAQPYYILKGHGKILVSPRGYNLDIEQFKTFLLKGLEEYNKL
ncbi:MAG: cytochrome c biogenesis protein CcdA [Bacteroidales bacterium]|nr:cytochrome c biogenesis protein CcdA [Bacteroidales bacterium]MDD4670380.1 cytochrome c biogenesis protein CcdA [Bacteroidales bacterium]